VGIVVCVDTDKGIKGCWVGEGRGVEDRNGVQAQIAKKRVKKATVRWILDFIYCFPKDQKMDLSKKYSSVLRLIF
jgi:hypothetical protein